VGAEASPLVGVPIKALAVPARGGGRGEAGGLGGERLAGMAGYGRGAVDAGEAVEGVSGEGAELEKMQVRTSMSPSATSL
jgi:hypothetical protein